MIGFSAFIRILESIVRRHAPLWKENLCVYGQQVIREATRFSEGLAEDVYRCKSCGYTE